MATKIKDLCVVVSSFTDKAGEKKNRYENVGHVMRMDDGSEMYCLKRTFNPAGCPNPDNRDTVVLSQFDVKKEAGAKTELPASSASQHQPAADIPF